MQRNEEPRSLALLCAELARLGAEIRAQEARVAGHPASSADEWLTRLGSAAESVAAAHRALAEPTRLPPEPGSAEDLRGSSRMPIQDLLCFLSTTKKSGVLRVEAARERFIVQLQEGAVVYASGDAPPPGEGLGELLRDQGEPSAELLTRLPGAARGEAWLDPGLIGTGWIPRESLAAAIQRLTRLSFFRMCSAYATRFRFYEGAEIQNAVPVRQNAMELLLESTRSVDEARARTAAGATARWAG